jgi:retron-type reverse transcriptase
MHGYNDIISLENLCAAWQEFLPGKKAKKDVADFSLDLHRNLFSLHEDIKNKSYAHGEYKAFNISDPKPRNIHKAQVRDRVLHHAVYKILYPYFDKKFIYDSYSCRNDRGVHKALNRFRAFGRRVSRNNTRTCWVLKCDIRKFFASVDQEALLGIVRKHIDHDTLWLLKRILESFSSTASGKGLPLGNLTSQLLVNVYMNEFDQFAKRVLKAKYYIRYADDFVFLSDNRTWLEDLIMPIESFLETELKLSLHPDKVSIKTFGSGIDFLGWVHFPDHRVLRTTTKRRMLKRIRGLPPESTVNSYRGMLKHGNSRKLEFTIDNALYRPGGEWA